MMVGKKNDPPWKQKMRKILWNFFVRKGENLGGYVGEK
jgi:hypothetical protein